MLVVLVDGVVDVVAVLFECVVGLAVGVELVTWAVAASDGVFAGMDVLADIDVSVLCVVSLAVLYGRFSSVVGCWCVTIAMPLMKAKATIVRLIEAVLWLRSLIYGLTVPLDASFVKLLQCY